MNLLILFFMTMTSVLGIVPAKYKTTAEKFYTELEQSKAYPVNPKHWAFIVAIEDYESTDPVMYSKNSGEMFKLLAQKRLRVGERRTYTLINEKATTGRIVDSLEQLVANVSEGDTIFFYYSGHGVPMPEENNEPYILPVDKVPTNLSTTPALKLSNIYKKLANSKATKIIAFVDSCFSGATDKVSVFKGAAATRLVAKRVKVDENKMSVMTAGKDKQFSNMYKVKGHRLFSYFLIKGVMQENLRDMSTLFRYVKERVKSVSFDIGDAFIQTPTLRGNYNLVF